jgi:hypothetical protein
MRRDALQRHELLHNGPPNLLQQGTRACNSCAAAKARCSGAQSGCTRCHARGQLCIYPYQSSPQPQTPSNTSFAGVTTHSEAQLAPPQDYYLHDDIFNADILSATNWLDALADGSPSFNFTADMGSASQLGNLLVQQNPLESPRPTLSLSGPSVSPHSTESDQAETCASYVDGDSGRPPHVKRPRLSSTVQITSHEGNQSTFTLIWRPENALDLACPPEISVETYDQIVDTFHRLCLSDWNGKAAFVSSSPPTKELLQQLMHSYWTSFDPVIPILHPILNRSISNLCLTLAMCAIGSHYVDAPLLFVVSMQEWLRRVLADSVQYPRDEQYLVLARFLCYVCSTYNGINAANGDREALKEVFDQAKSLFWNSERSSIHPNTSWDMWLQREQSKRVAYSAWLLDAMHATHRQTRALLTLEDANMPLPCDDQLWDAKTSAEWQVLMSTKTPCPSLQESLQQIYISKRVPRDRGEFARILMIHGLYHRLWDVSRYYSNPLSSWEPSGERQESTMSGPVWLPSVPAFSKWQNSTCDALDILHWQANATIGQHSGFEHPTVLHLHFARVVLLAPCEHIVTLAKHCTGAYGMDQVTADTAAHQVQRWAVQHQFKARLAAIHAGVLFWHVRHHSADAFYEAPVVALATLTLWAFGNFARRQHSNDPQWAVTPSVDPEQSRSVVPTANLPAKDPNALNSMDEDDMCEIILLDRPTDDELVQQFIRRGHRMQAHITGVGDLYGAKGPFRVLSQGHKLLNTLRHWGIHSEWSELLARLESVSADNPSWTG